MQRKQNTIHLVLPTNSLLFCSKNLYVQILFSYSYNFSIALRFSCMENVTYYKNWLYFMFIYLRPPLFASYLLADDGTVTYSIRAIFFQRIHSTSYRQNEDGKKYQTRLLWHLNYLWKIFLPFFYDWNGMCALQAAFFPQHSKRKQKISKTDIWCYNKICSEYNK